MEQAFERGFVSELRACLAKFAGTTPGGRAQPSPPPSRRPASPFAPAPGPGAPVAGQPPGPPRPPGLSKGAGVASGLERLYLTLGPSAAAKDALQFATPRMDAHLVGRDAAKLLARKRTGFGDLVARGRRSADRARGVLEKGAGDEHPRPSSGELTEAMGDVEALEHRIRHLAPPEERREIHHRGRALGRERTRARDAPRDDLGEKTASPFADTMRSLAEALLRAN